MPAGSYSVHLFVLVSVLLVMPFYFIMLPVLADRSTRLPFMRLRFSQSLLLAVLLMWVGLVMLADFRSGYNDESDNMADNVAALMLGWFMALIACAPFISLRFIILWIKRRRAAKLAVN